VKKNSFELLELEMADLEHFWRKTPLGPLGVNIQKLRIMNYKILLNVNDDDDEFQNDNYLIKITHKDRDNVF
jgi:mRNA-degrading endonuclease RelE of RelBE toxin-antitoxin system